MRPVRNGILPDDPGQRPDRCHDPVEDHPHQDRGREPGDGVRHTHPAALYGSQARGREQRSSEQQEREPAEHERRERVPSPPGNTGQDRKGPSDGAAEAPAVGGAQSRGMSVLQSTSSVQAG